jgi:hypothetical protein
LTIGLSLLALALPRSLGAGEPDATLGVAAVGRPAAATSAEILERVRGLPLRFEANQGQTNPQVDFIARGRGYTMFLTPRESVLMLRGSTGRGQGESSTVALRVQLVGANAQPRGVGLEELPGRVNYLLGKDPAQWRRNVPAYAKVRYPEIYQGIDLVYYGTQRQLEYDFVLRPGADPGRIVLGFEGAEKIELDPKGDLLLHVAGGAIRHRKPVIYQEIAGARRAIAGGYVLKGAREVGFTVAAYDESRPLVIDPVLFYSTYFGGTGDDAGHAIAVDADGDAYVTGRAYSADFPTTAGAFDATLAGLTDAFVTKLDPAGSGVVYSTYLGGTGDEKGQGIAVDSAGNAYVFGETTSTDFPTTPGAFQVTPPGGAHDVFVAKLDPTGSALVYSTYLGGTGDEKGQGIAVDSAGSAYVTGRTGSGDFPRTLGAVQATLGGRTDGFVTKLNPAGSALVYSTYLGGASDDKGVGIAVDADGNAYVAGETGSRDFPTTPGAFQATSPGGTFDAFVTKLNPSGSALVYSTYLGGKGSDRGFAIALDAPSNPNAYVTGHTASTDFPTTPGAFQVTPPGGAHDVFVAKLNPSGTALVYATHLGGTGDDVGEGIAVDPAGNAYVTGQTTSVDFPITVGGFQMTLGGLTDAFVTKLDPTGSALVYSTYLGGTGDDVGHGITVDSAGSAYVTGETGSTNFPTTAGAFDTTLGGLQDGFVAKIADFGPSATLGLAPNAASNLAGTQHCVTATVQDAAGNLVRGVTVRFSVTGANSASGSAKTDGSGQAPFCYTGTRAGNDAIAAYPDTNNNGFQDPSEPGGTATKTWVAGAAATLILAPSTATNPVNTQHCVTATATDAFGNPVPSVTVPFSVTGAVTATGAAPTDATGHATFCYMGPTTPGSDSIAAFADTNSSGAQEPGEPSGTATKKWAVPGAPETLTLAPSAATNPVGTQHCVAATVRDGWGNPLAGVTVRFTVTGSATTTGSAATDASGQAPFCYPGPSTAGADTITAFADANNSAAQDPGEPGASATKKWAVPGAPATLTLAPSVATNPVSTQHCLIATVTDAFASAVVGVTVQFVVSGSVATTGSAVTDGTGQAPFCYIGPSQSGTDSISAFADSNNNGAQDLGEPGGTATKSWAAAGGTTTQHVAELAAPTGRA